MASAENLVKSSFFDALNDELRQRESQHMRRSLRAVSPALLDLSSNDYLGLSRHPKVVKAACEAIQTFGTGARASRLVSGHLDVHAELESALAGFKNSESALVFSSGYAANLSVISALSNSETAIFCDKRNHASLIDGCRLATSYGARVRYYSSPEKLQTLLTRDVSTRTVVVSDTVYSMDGDIADVPQLVELSERFGAILLLDDAHGVGTLGETGQGALEHFAISPRENIIQVGTLSKALGAQGGFVVASKTVTDWMVNAARPFIYSTGLAPSCAAAALAALRVLESQPDLVNQLRAVTQKLAAGIAELKLDVRAHPTPIIPVVFGDAGDAVSWSEKLCEAGVWCPPIRPPTVPRGTSRLRVTASAALRDEQIETALRAFEKVKA